MRVTLVLLALLAGCVVIPRAGAGENLLKNGNFDAGEKTAEHWEIPDGLTAMWVHEEGRGRVLKMNTQVEKEQARDWNKQFRADPDPERRPPEPKILDQKSYGTIGGFDGVLLDSEFIECKPGQNYKLVVDVKAAGSPFVWIKGWMQHRGRWREAYQTRLQTPGAKPDRWRTYEIGFNPTKRTPKVTKFKVRCYAYWPNGIYYFDNLRVEEIDEAEMARLVAAREEVHDEK